MMSENELQALYAEARAWLAATGTTLTDLTIAMGRAQHSAGWLAMLLRGEYRQPRVETIAALRNAITVNPDGIEPPVRMKKAKELAETTQFRKEMLDYRARTGASWGDIARLGGWVRNGGSWISDIAEGGTAPKPETMVRLRQAMRDNPDGFGERRVVVGGVQQLRLPPDWTSRTAAAAVSPEDDLADRRDEAARRRASWVEQQRQAELAKYGRTTILRQAQDDRFFGAAA